MDEYFHEDPNVMYIDENIPGSVELSKEYEDLICNYNSQLLHYCSCTQDCRLPDCTCLLTSDGSNYKFDEKFGTLTLNEMKFINSSILECNSLCQCSENCGNKLVQYGPRKQLTVKPCEINSKGKGLFSNTDLAKGTFICEYAGEIITKSQAISRQEENDLKGNMNYIFCLNEHVGNSLVQTIIDPSIFGNIGRYINHSCDPNCKIIPVRVDCPVPKLAIFSVIPIVAGNELTFNYGPQNLIKASNSEEAARNKKCLCKSKNCSGFMPFDNY